MDSVGRRAKESRKLLLAGVFVNLVLALTKIAGGLFGRSHALIADGMEKCRVRKSGFMRFADIHVRVAGESTVREGHDIAHSVKNRLLDRDFYLADVVVHIEPETHQD